MTILRPLDPARDGPALHAVFGDTESCRYLPDPPTRTVGETTALLRKWMTGCEDVTWAVTSEPDGDALGRVTYYREGADGVWGAGCMIIPAARGKNLAAKALAQTVPYMFGVKKARRLFADIDPDNIASVRVFERLGFQYEGRLRAAWDTHIGIRDSLIYSLIDSDPFQFSNCMD